jgi:hypothetical protein
MTKKHNYFYTISLLVIVATLFSVYASDKDVDKIKACVDFNPKIVVCGKSFVSQTRMHNAIRTWEKVGYSFEEIVYLDEDSCIDYNEYGTIIISKPKDDFDYNYLAVTKRFTIKILEQDYILYSKIYIPRKELRKERVLEHEIGHALGWDHFDSTYHIMHENWGLGGNKMFGLDKNIYDKKCVQ